MPPTQTLRGVERGYAYETRADLHVLSCGGCGVMFAMPETMFQKRLEDHKGFFCPNGHSRYFSGPSEAEKLRKQLEEKQAQLERERQALNYYSDALSSEKRSHAATKGNLTKTKKRAAAGLCPAGCRRNFVQMGRHLRNQHPDFVGAEQPSD